MEFVAYVGQDRESWGQITALLNRLEYETAVLVVDAKISDFPSNERCTIIPVNADKPLLELQEQCLRQLKPALSRDFEVALSLASGNGKEHMALLSALLSIPVGIQFVVFTKEGVQYLS